MILCLVSQAARLQRHFLIFGYPFSLMSLNFFWRVPSEPLPIVYCMYRHPCMNSLFLLFCALPSYRPHATARLFHFFLFCDLQNRMVLIPSSFISVLIIESRNILFQEKRGCFLSFLWLFFCFSFRLKIVLIAVVECWPHKHDCVPCEISDF